jgi:hypothetical protein
MFSRICHLGDDATSVLNRSDWFRLQWVNTPDPEEGVLCHMGEEPGARSIAAMERVSQNSCMNVTWTATYCHIFSD